MQVTFGTFNFASSDLNSENDNYLNYHVNLAKSLPGVRLYLTGTTRQTRRIKPDRYRAAILAFDSAEAAQQGRSGEPGAKLAADAQVHLKDMRREQIDAQWVVPFDSRKPGQSCFIMAALLNFKPADKAAAEEHYLGYHVGVARRMPGLRGYLIGKTVAAGDSRPDRYRAAILVWDEYEAFRAAYQSPVGLELVRDEDYLLADPRVYYIDGRVEV